MKFLRRFSAPSPPPEARLPYVDRALVRRLELGSPRRLATALAGAYRSQFRGQGMEFSELRPYEPGDDIRRIDWNVTARTGIPHVRQYREERSRCLTLLLDISASCADRKRDLLLETTALLAFAAVNSGDRLAVIAFSNRVEHLILPQGGVRHARRVLAELAGLRLQTRDTNLLPPLDAALALNRRPGMFILLSDLHTRLPQQRLSEVLARHDLLTLILRDPLEQHPPNRGLLRVEDKEQGTEQLLDLTTAAGRAELQAAWHEHDAELGRKLRALGIEHAQLNAGESPLPTLLRLFRRRSGRRP